MNLGLNLVSRCHVNENGDGDRFVGIKAASDKVMVYFPLGYNLPESEAELRDDILQLISVLAEFMEKKDRVLHMPRFAAPQSVDFPVNAYISVIRLYLKTGSYYKENEPVKKCSDKGRIDWAASLKKKIRLFFRKMVLLFLISLSLAVLPLMIRI